METRIENRPATRVAYLRDHGAYHKIFRTLWPRFAPLAAQKGLFKPGALTVSIMHDTTGPTPENERRADAAIMVDESFQGDGDLKVQTLPAGKYIVARHKGAYANLHLTWAEFHKTVLPQQKVRAGACFEIYVSNPQTTPEAELVTDLYVPIE